MSPTEGIVVGLYGPWGSGKTTLLNFVSYYLASVADSERPIVIPFNPWWFSGDEDLTRRFFDQLVVTLSGAAKREKALKKVAAKIAQFADVMGKTPMPYADLIGKAVGQASRVITTPRDLHAIKAGVEKVLSESPHRVLVVIDDIDRLTGEEIRQVFRLVKAVADFPNITYLLAFDKTVVVRALDSFQGGSGADYLEKIVQVPFELPPPDKVLLRGLLFDELAVITAGTPQEFLDQNYWVRLYFAGLDTFIETPRDVIRLCNTLSVTYRAVRGEVNCADFIAIEALRLFEPDAYEMVRGNQASFAGALEAGSPTRDTVTAERAFHEQWLQRLPAENRERLSNLLRRLFPRLDSLWSEIRFASDSASDWRQAARICSPDHFATYFRLAVPGTMISNFEMRAILSLAGDADGFGLKLLELAAERTSVGSSRARLVLERLPDYTQTVPEEHVAPVVGALLKIGDQLLIPEDRPKTMFALSNDQQMGVVIHQVISRLNEPDRFEVLSRAVQDGNALSLISRVVGSLSAEHGRAAQREPKPEPECALSSEHIVALEGITLDRFRTAAESGTLVNVPQLDHVLYRWRDWAGVDEPARWLQELASSDENLPVILEGFLRTSLVQSGDSAPRLVPSLDPAVMKDFLNPESIVDRVRRLLDSASLSDRQHTALARFVHEYEIRQRGGDPMMEDE